MARPNPIRRIMQSALPSVTYQRQKLFRPSPKDVKYAYKIINRHVFNNQLKLPPIQLGVTRGYWGMCIGLHEETSPNTLCSLKLSDKYFCVQWFMNTLAHEMVHQYQWDINSEYRQQHGLEPLMSHGPSFFAWRDVMDYYGLSLKTAHGQRRWFAHQDFNKC
jgi:hypothetical protein